MAHAGDQEPADEITDFYAQQYPRKRDRRTAATGLHGRGEDTDEHAEEDRRGLFSSRTASRFATATTSGASTTFRATATGSRWAATTSMRRTPCAVVSRS